MKLLVLSIFMIGLLAGCASYQYEITEPAEFAQHIGSKDEVSFRRDPLEYRLQTLENRLVLRIYNHGVDTMTLVGERSFVVDTGGQSHPLRTVTLASQSFIKLILPPTPPVYERAGPSMGIGIGAGFSDARRRGYIYDPENGLYGGPRYFSIYDDEQFYWDWKGESEVRLSLFFDRAGTSFTHEFTIARKKI